MRNSINPNVQAHIKPIVEPEFNLKDHLRETPIIGAKDGDKFVSWPHKDKFEALTREQLANLKLSSIEWKVDTKIRALKVTLNDGDSFTQNAGGHKVSDKFEFAGNSETSKVEIRHYNGNTLYGIRFYDKNG